MKVTFSLVINVITNTQLKTISTDTFGIIMEVKNIYV